ncbi:MAG: 50S ribosomal protein L7/L12 [Candidatus Parcubacteria bacterium]|nr:50S ribosomal protein L7/L12 [Candidatus Parcubacteria bacterium]
MSDEKESTAAKASEDKVKVPAKFKDLVAEIEKMSVLDLAELVKVLEDKFGVSAAAPMAMMAGPAAAADAAPAKSEFDIELAAVGDNKIGVIKIVKDITGLGLKEAKDMVDAAPKIIKAGVKKVEAEEIRKKLVEVGASVNLK